MTINDDSHSYIPATPGDSRSPCPALNALANHGYLPRDGRNITVTQLVSAIRHIYGISLPFASILALGGVAKCGHWKGLGMVVDLHELAKHNAVEHDGSLVHADTAPGEVYAPTAVDPVLLRHLLETSTTDVLTRRDLCRAQLTRQAASRPLNSTQSFVSKGELDLIHQVFGIPSSERSSSTPAEGHELVVPKAVLEDWLGREKLPEGWSGPLREVGLLELVGQVREIEKVETEMVASGKGTL
ncbi:Cloroperoxidase [Lentinus tigrinus ALCF2SS1-7]|uniref:Cloroperoxidase n=1 Tax=Lentinus tigrinus ALCF2SS1-6 TaxID=1328759 RepID=A0A5C2STP5_9APHY|nr:Cloroperoxidase [Lentinus tigrinus ALCF2SS1-6]RPD81253.1 Cloroperoxidase [Lentinus tigrinus ALCF2SS1-7]